MDHHFYDLETSPESHQDVLRRVREFLIWSGFAETVPHTFERGRGIHFNSRKAWSTVTITPLESAIRVHYKWRGLGIPAIGPMAENQFGEFQDALIWAHGAQPPTIHREQQSTSGALFQLILYTLMFVFIGVSFITGNRTAMILSTTISGVLLFVLKGALFSVERPPLEGAFPLQP
jgi:hypothetical protein